MPVHKQPTQPENRTIDTAANEFKEKMNDNHDPLFQPLNGAISTLQRVGVIYWKSGTVRLFLKLAILFVVPATCLLLALVYTALHYHRQNNNNHNQYGLMDSFGYYVTVLGSQSLIRDTLGAIAEGAIAVAVADLYLQRHPRWFTCLQKTAASAKAAKLVLAGLLSGACILVGYILGYLPGLFLKLNFLLVTPVIMLEEEFSILSNLGRSWDLVHGHRWYVCRCFLGLELTYWMTNWLLRYLLLLGNTIDDDDDDGDDESHPFFTLSYHFLASFPKSIFVPAFGILKTVLYIQLAVVKEHLTAEQFATQIDQGTMVMAGHVPLLVDRYDDNDDDNDNDAVDEAEMQTSISHADDSFVTAPSELQHVTDMPSPVPISVEK